MGPDCIGRPTIGFRYLRRVAARFLAGRAVDEAVVASDPGASGASCRLRTFARTRRVMLIP
jgi:hypothetical protein